MGMKLTFTCAACHRESPTTGRKAARVLGLRTWVCGPCKTGMHVGKGPKPKPVRELLLGKISRASGLQPAMLIGRIAKERQGQARDELEKLIGEGAVLLVSRPTAAGQQAKRLFTDQAKADKWRQEPDRRAIPTFKPARQGMKKLAPVQEQSVGLGWRNLKPPKDAPAITPKCLKPQVLDSQPVFSRHQVKPGEVVPSVISGAECRPWARQCFGGVL